MVGREREMQWWVEKGECNGGQRKGKAMVGREREMQWWVEKGNAMYWFHRHRMLCIPIVTIMGPAMELGS